MRAAPLTEIIIARCDAEVVDQVRAVLTGRAGPSVVVERTQSDGAVFVIRVTEVESVVHALFAWGDAVTILGPAGASSVARRSLARMLSRHRGAASVFDGGRGGVR